MKKKLLVILGVLLVVAICAAVATHSAFAADIVAEGTCGADGDDLTWTLDSDGVLTISGEGAMADYTLGSIPWLDYRATITSVVVGDGISGIGSYAFARCTEMESINLPRSLATVFPYAFYGCNKLSVVNYDGTEITAGDIEIDGTNSALVGATWNYLWEPEVTESGYCGYPYGDGTYYQVSWVVYEDGLLIISGEGEMGDYKDPAGSSYMYAPPWYAHTIKKVIIQPGVTSIGDFAFIRTDIKNITIPESVVRIGKSAFANCGCIRNITLPSGLTCIEDGTFSYSSIRTVDIPEGVTSIGAQAFYNCKKLESITIPENLTTLGQAVFYQCESLAEITLPESLTSIPEYAFYGCSGITDINIPGGIQSLGAYSFYSCSSLETNITIPDGVINIEDYTFFRCAITGITLPGGLVSIGNWAFSGCSGLTKIDFPEGLTSIGEQAFRECVGLTDILIPDDVSYLGSAAFLSCESLESINIPDGISEIHSSTFAYCYKLTTVVIPGGITRLDRHAFNSNSSLTTVMIPDSVTVIDENFESCHNIRDVYYSGSEEQWNSIDFGIYGNALSSPSITMHYNYVYPYISGVTEDSFSWTRYSDGALVISGKSVNSECSMLGAMPWAKRSWKVVSLVLEDGISGIKEFAFSGYENLKTVEFGKCVETIGEGAFFACPSLTALYLSNSATKIEIDAFGACDALSDVCYLGTAEEWDSISIGSGNDVLAAANKHLGPDWTFAGFDWDKDGSGKVYAMFTCSKCGRTGYIPAEVTQSGSVLTATAEFNGAQYTDSMSDFVTITNCKLELAGKISIRLYFRAPQNAKTAKIFYENVSTHEYPEKASVTLSLSRTGNPNYSSSQDLFIMTFPKITSREMTRHIKFVVYDENGQPMAVYYSQGNKYFEDGFEYCAADWANRILGKADSTDEARFMAKALLNYGGCAQVYLSNYNPDYPANPLGYLAEEMEELQPDPDQFGEVGAGVYDLGFDRATLSLEADTTIRLYFNNPVKVYVDGVEKKVYSNNGTYLAMIEGISSRNISKKYQITVTSTDGSESSDLYYSVLSWANIQIATGNERSTPTAKALYLYNQAARAYIK